MPCHKYDYVTNALKFLMSSPPLCPVFINKNKVILVYFKQHRKYNFHKIIPRHCMHFDMDV